MNQAEAEDFIDLVSIGVVLVRKMTRPCL
jgi:hypothetical protein